jgi:hypothetical protein
MDSSDFSNVCYAMSDDCDGWAEVRPLGGPVKMHLDGIHDSYYDKYIKDNSGGKITMKLECFNKEFLDEVTHLSPVCGFFYKSNVRRMTYPATVRQAKARHKGNRGNGKRRYEYVVVQCVMHDVRIRHETVHLPA